jgi:hypothetical protein
MILELLLRSMTSLTQTKAQVKKVGGTLVALIQKKTTRWLESFTIVLEASQAQ